MRDYQKALSMDPTFSLAYYNAGNMYFHSRQFTQVRDCLIPLREEPPGVDAVYVRRVRAKLRVHWNDQDHPLHEELA